MEERRSFTRAWEAARRWPEPDSEKLDRVLVAGLLLETILDVPTPAKNHQTQLLTVKARLKHNLVTHLAGQVTLDHFRTLVRNLDHWFPYYYPLVSQALPQAEDPGSTGGTPARPAIPAPFRPGLREEALQDWLGRHVQELLPHRPHRKLNPEKLREFLGRTQGGWFRVKDFQSHFLIDRKTAWEYLQKLQVAGLLDHNGGRSAAVRYCLADRFLLISTKALRRKLAEALADLPPGLALQVADWLIATGGEAFREEQWRERLPDAQRQAAISRLKAAGVLQVLSQAGGGRLLRLSPDWAQGADA